PVFYDTHAHLDYPDFAEDLPQVIERAKAAGIMRIISIGTNLESSVQAVKLAERFSSVYAAVGWHPCHAPEAMEDVRPALRALARHPKVVAIGEVGLDYHHLPGEQPGRSDADDGRYKQKQDGIFRQMLEVAAEFGLNCVVYQRDEMEDVLAQMQQVAGEVGGVVSCFVILASDWRWCLA